MPTLSIVKDDFKKALKIGGIALGLIVVLLIFIRISITVKNVLFPPPPPTASATFGRLPVIDFPNSIEKSFTYEIDTLTGELPLLPNLTDVYKMEQRGPDLLAVEKASDQAKALGFNRNPQQISDFLYRWTNPNPPNQILIQDIRLDEFNLTSSFLNYESSINVNFKDETEAAARAKSFISGLNMNTNDFDEEKTKVEYQLLKNGTITNTNRFIVSNMATVYFFQKDRNEVPIVYPQGKNSTMKIVVTADGFKEWILEASYSRQNILEESSTYPIKTAEQAFEELKNGGGFITGHSGDNTNIKIKEVYLALYSEGKLQEYLTPVIVFEGDNNFVAYVPAITDEWIDK